MRKLARSAFLFVVHGFVQGVGYRYMVKKAADAYGICGFVRNADDGSVEICAEGDASSISKFEAAIMVHHDNGPDVYRVYRKRVKHFGFDSFSIKH